MPLCVLWECNQWEQRQQVSVDGGGGASGGYAGYRPAPNAEVLMCRRTKSILEINHWLLTDLDQPLLRPVEVYDYK